MLADSNIFYDPRRSYTFKRDVTFRAPSIDRRVLLNLVYTPVGSAQVGGL